MNNNPYEPNFAIRTEHAELYSINVRHHGSATITLQLLIYEPTLNRFGEKTVRDIKEQEIELKSVWGAGVPSDPKAFLEGWATVVAEALMGYPETMMPRDFFRGFESAAGLKKARTVEDYVDAFRAKTRLGKFELNVGTKPLPTPLTRSEKIVVWEREFELREGYHPPAGKAEEVLFGEVVPATYPTPRNYDSRLFEVATDMPINQDVFAIETTLAGPGDDESEEDPFSGGPLEEKFSAPAPTLADRLATLKRKLEGLAPGTPFREKREREIQKSIRKIGKKLVQSVQA